MSNRRLWLYNTGTVFIALSILAGVLLIVVTVLLALVSSGAAGSRPSDTSFISDMSLFYIGVIVLYGVGFVLRKMNRRNTEVRTDE